MQTRRLKFGMVFMVPTPQQSIMCNFVFIVFVQVFLMLKMYLSQVRSGTVC